ncbi:MAG: response regulator transcription factor [Flavobacteriaceae bacterium]|nr:response regulator transcription factor [Flavobacteriaceae bacterium]
MKKILLYDSLFFYGKGLQTIMHSNFTEIDVVMVHSHKIVLEECEKNIYDVVIIDLFYDNRFNFVTLKKIKTLQSKSKLFVISDVQSSDFKSQCSKIGVDFLLLKNCSESYFIAALKLALYGNSYFTKKVRLNVPSGKAASSVAKTLRSIETLSSREYEIALMMVNGITNTAICQKMNLAMTTISTYKKRIFLKTKTTNLIEVARLFKKIEN